MIPQVFDFLARNLFAHRLLLVQRVQDFEAFLYTELVKDAPDPSAPMCVVLLGGRDIY